MKKSALLFIGFVGVLFFGAEILRAEERTIRIEGREHSTVTTADIFLADIASVSSRRIDDSESVIALKQLRIGAAPEAGEERTFRAREILDVLRMSGVRLERIGYILPQSVTVTRASRPLQKDEIMAAIRHALEGFDREMALKSITYPEDVRVLPGPLSLTAIPRRRMRPGNIRFQIQAETEQGQAKTFDVGAVIEEWAELPVARHALERGTVISEEDLTTARLNLRRVPLDAKRSSEQLLGMELSRNIGAGSVFRRDMVHIPPVIESGERVSMIVRSRFFEASARGVALEAGAIGDNIRIRNTESRKVITGTVLEPGLVGVSP